MTGAKTLSKSQICISTPRTLADHRAAHGERWGVFSPGTNVGQFTCTHGSSSYREFKSTTSVDASPDDNRSPWCKNSTGTDVDDLPFRAMFNVGKEYYANAEARFESTRSWPKFTGFSFESYNSKQDNNVMYLRRVATIWVPNNGGTIYCATSLDGSTSRGESNQYNYWSYSFLSDSTEAKLQDDGYRFMGFRFNYRSKSGTGGSKWKYVDIFHLKLHTNYPDMPDKTRVVLPKMMKSSGGYPRPTPYGGDA